VKCQYPIYGVAIHENVNADSVSIWEFRFYFFSNEGDPREAIHIHVRGACGEAKYWVEPDSVGAQRWL